MHDTASAAMNGVLRRDVLRGIAGAVLSVGTVRKVHAGPPTLRNGRHQFTEIMPPRVFAPVSLVDLSGKTAVLSQHLGKVLLVNLWATWCAACRTELPTVDRLQSQLAGQVQVAKVSLDKGDRREVAETVRKLGIGSSSVFLDPDGRLANMDPASDAPLTLYGMPMTYLVSPSGQIVGYLSGAADWLSDEARQLLSYYSSSL